MNRPWWDEVERDPIHARAAEWLAQLDSPQVSLEETIAWQEWMERDPRHTQAFDRMEELGRVLKKVPRPSMRQDSGHPILPFSIAQKSKDRTRNWLALAAGVAAITIASWLMSHRDGSLSGGAQMIQTAVGENRVLRLPDGSNVTLGGNTRLKFSMSDALRSISLLQGEALFAVAKESARPFIVRTRDVNVTAVGTAFNVRRSGNRTIVAVVEGRVRVETPPDRAPLAWFKSDTKVSRTARRLDSGQQAMVNEEGVQPTSTLPNMAAATAWQAGQLTFRNEPLSYVVEDVNRYAKKPIEIEDAAVAELKFTGTVFNNNIAGWVHSLESVFRIKAVEEQDKIVLSR